MFPGGVWANVSNLNFQGHLVKEIIQNSCHYSHKSIALSMSRFRALPPWHHLTFGKPSWRLCWYSYVWSQHWLLLLLLTGESLRLTDGIPQMDYLIQLMGKVSVIFENLSGWGADIHGLLLYIMSQGQIEHPRYIWCWWSESWLV